MTNATNEVAERCDNKNCIDGVAQTSNLVRIIQVFISHDGVASAAPVVWSGFDSVPGGESCAVAFGATCVVQVNAQMFFAVN